MNATQAMQFRGDDRRRRVECVDSRWLLAAELWSPRDPDELITGDGETAVLLLAGTFDLVGGSTAWPARGARRDPFSGRPMAVFLPPRTPFRVSNGGGELLLVSARQPAAPQQDGGREGLARKPLLPMAGSGKAFDPNSGEWRPAETFPTAPESLPPRRFERLPVGACTVERVLPPDYKAATLSIDEVVVPAGQSLVIAAIPGRPDCAELALFTRAAADGALLMQDPPLPGGQHSLRGDGVLVLPGRGDGIVITAGAGAVYVVLAYAGKSGRAGNGG